MLSDQARDRGRVHPLVIDAVDLEIGTHPALARAQMTRQLNGFQHRVGREEILDHFNIPVVPA